MSAEDCEICEGCEKTLRSGDLACSDADGCFFCEACAPTWADTLREWEEVVADPDRLSEMDFTAEEAGDRIAAVKANIARLGADAKNVSPLQ